ncbi:hypothetical protein CJ667_10680, partial [Aliarcobacter cryaerophilus]
MLKNNKTIIYIVFFLTCLFLILYYLFSPSDYSDQEEKIDNIELKINSATNVLEKNTEQNYNYYLNKTNLL